MRAVTDASFDADVLNASGAVVVDFWAPWCKPCEAVTSTLEVLAEESPQAAFVALDIDENPVSAARCQVLSIPTVMLFRDGVAVTTIFGKRDARAFRRAFEPFF